MGNLTNTSSCDEIINGKKMHKMAQLLWPITRSITGDGVRKTLDHIKQEIPELNLDLHLLLEV